MDVNLYLLLALLATLLVIAYLLTRLHRVRGQLSLIKDALMDIKSSIVIRDSRFVNEFHILKATCKFCTRLSTFVMTFPFFPLLL